MAVTPTKTDDFIFIGAGTSHDETDVAIGSAASDRLVFVKAFAPVGGSGLEITGMTIGGVTAARARRDVQSAGGGAVFGDYETWWALVPTGTTATVSFECSANWGAEGGSFIVYSVTGANTTTPVSDSDFTSRADAVANALSLDIDIPANGAAIGATGLPLVSGSGTVTYAWSGLTEDFDVHYALNGGARVGRSSASMATDTLLSGHTVAATATVTSSIFVDRGMQVIALQAATKDPSFQAHVIA